MAAAYNPRVSGANRTEGKHFKEVWNQSLFNIDSWVILSGTPNLDAAYKFLDFISDPNRQKDSSESRADGNEQQGNSLLDRQGHWPESPTAPENFAHAAPINTQFWLDNYDKLNDCFTKWAAQ